MHTEDTITAISTPPGSGGIGIVRLSGGNSITIADKIFRASGGKKLINTPSHMIIHGHILDPVRKEVVDEVLVSVMRAPRTYTREDIVEINCHGGPVPLKRVLELSLKYGARAAGPGEFTLRAFLNGRIDLAQAEAVLDIINAMTVESQKSAVEQLGGGLSGKIGAVREGLVQLAAFVEAYIDFPEDDIESMSVDEMKDMAMKIRGSIEVLVESSRYGMILRQGLRAAIIGRPNVGKSSLLNALLEHDRAIVTEAPGTTRDVIEECLNIRGIPLRIMDTAGIRNVAETAEQEGVRRSRRAMEDADMVLLVVDGSRPLGDMDRELIEKASAENVIIVINKSDLPWKLGPTESFADPARTVSISAKQETGLDALKKMIAESALKGHAGDGADIVTNARHVHALEKALASVNSFMDELSKGTPPEFLSVELREALDAVGDILGITTPDEILERIFSSFCIGK